MVSCDKGYVAGSVDMFDLEWHHVAGVYDGVRLHIYIDGVRKDCVDASGSIKTNDYDVCIGEDPEKLGREWRDLIDDVRIYDYALSSEEILHLACEGNNM